VILNLFNLACMCNIDFMLLNYRDKPHVTFRLTETWLIQINGLWTSAELPQAMTSLSRRGSIAELVVHPPTVPKIRGSNPDDSQQILLTSVAFEHCTLSFEPLFKGRHSKPITHAF
jgi:hypothetical protein